MSSAGCMRHDPVPSQLREPLTVRPTPGSSTKTSSPKPMSNPSGVSLRQKW